MIACAIFSMAVFAQTPATSGKTKAAQAEQVKKGKTATQSSKETLSKDKSGKKSDAKKHVSRPLQSKTNPQGVNEGLSGLKFADKRECKKIIIK